MPDSITMQAPSFKEAVQIAAAYVKEVFPRAERVRVEEIESPEDERTWLITLSFIDRDFHQLLPLGVQVAPEADRKLRDYKILTIDRQSGSVRSMRVRELHHAV